MNPSKIIQVPNDTQLLELMLTDNASSPECYKSTNYWAVYQKKFLPELYSFGLHNFRRRENSILASFGASDLSSQPSIDLSLLKFFSNQYIANIKVVQKFVFFINTYLNKILPIKNCYDIKTEDLEKLCYEFAHIYGQQVGARSINQFEASTIGNPSAVFEVNKKKYTMTLVNYYLQYVYCYKYIDFNSLKIIVELGSGSGKQVEIIKKLHPDICFILYDIPPQLYVCEQYLKTIFPESVVSYRDTRAMECFPEDRKGKIFILGTHKFPLIENLKVDLFWNSASFQEMEPEIVANYLKYVNRCVQTVYLREAMAGKEKAKKREKHGVIQQTLLKHYEKYLDNYILIDLSPSIILPRMTKGTTYSDSFWKFQKNDKIS